MVNVQKGAEHAGFDAAMHAKKVSQHRGDGQACREKVYEDSTATTDIGAFLMGRTPQRIEKLRSVAMTRIHELAKFGKPSDVAEEDEIRVRVVAQDKQRASIESALAAYKKVVTGARSKPQRAQAQLKVPALTTEQKIITRRLEARMLEEKRQQVYADGQRALADMPKEEFKARKEVRDLSGMTRLQLVTRYAEGPKRAVKVAASTKERPKRVQEASEAASYIARDDREASRAHRIARRAEQQGFQLDDLERAEVALAELSEQRPIAEAAVEPEKAAETQQSPEVLAVVELEGAAAEVLAAVELEGAAAVQVQEVPVVMEVPVAAEAALDYESAVAAMAGAAGEATGAQGPKGREKEFSRKRAAEEALLAEYESAGIERAEFAAQKKMRLGTLDGVFCRVRKRRREEAAMRC